MSLKKAKLTSKSLLSRLGGLSAFGFGISFKPQETDRSIVRPGASDVPRRQTSIIRWLHMGTT